MNIGLQQKRLNRITEKIKGILKPFDFYVSDWMVHTSTPTPWIQLAYIEHTVDINAQDIIDKTDDEVYLLIRDKLIEGLTLTLTKVKKL